MRHLTRFTLAVGTIFTVASAAGAQTVVAAPGTPYNAPALTGSQTLGNGMGGMIVTGFTQGGGTFSGAWTSLGSGNWGVVTDAFSVTLGGTTDTFGGAWTLATIGQNQLTGLRFSGAPGGTVFDRTFSPFPGTNGSADGSDFRWLAGDMWTTLVTYTNVVSIAADPAVGDIYEQVNVGFGTVFSGSANFSMDTDNIPLGTQLTPVPEPSTVVLMASGLIAVAAMGRRRLFRGTNTAA